MHHDMMVDATREDELNLARIGLEHSETNMSDASLKLRKLLRFKLPVD